MKKEKNIIRKNLKNKKKLIRNMKRLLGKDKSSKDDGEDDDYNIETQTETDPELPTNLQEVNPGDVVCDICKRKFPGTGSLRKDIDKMHKGKGKFKYQKVYMTKKGQRNCELKHKGIEKPFQCDVDGCDIHFYSMRSKKKHERQQHRDHVEEKTNYVSFKIKVVHTGHTLMITCSSIRGHVNSTQIGLDTSVSCVEKQHKGYN